MAGNSSANSKGLIGSAGTVNLANGFTGAAYASAAGAKFATPAELASARSGMGAYGQNTNDLALIVPSDQYYNMIHATGFTDISEVGSDLATKVTGEVGSIFGIKVIVSDEIASYASGGTAGIMVNTANFVRPRLGGVNFETEYSVVVQRTNLVASQSVGFNQIIADGKSASVIAYA